MRKSTVSKALSGNNDYLIKVSSISDFIMNQTSSRNTILAQIRSGLQQFPASLPYPDIDTQMSILKKAKTDESIDIEFAVNFTQNEGRFIYCEDKEEFHKHLKDISRKTGWRYIYCWQNELIDFLQEKDFRQCKIGHRLDKAHAGITTCEALVADTGSIIFSSDLQAGRSLAIFPPVWIVVATVNQVKKNLKRALKDFNDKYPETWPSMLSIVSGPASTQSMGMQKISGGMGMQEIHLFFLDTETI